MPKTSVPRFAVFRKEKTRMIQWIQTHTELLILLAIGTVFTFTWQMLTRKRLCFPWYAALPLSFLHTVLGVGAVMAFAFLENIGTSRPGAMSLFGAIWFLPVFYWLLSKATHRKAAVIFDVFTICMAFTLMCARVNCLLSGCCLGAIIPGTGEIRWPTRELELVFYAVILTVFCIRTLKGKNYGELYPLYMACYGAFRFVIEFFREAEHAAGLFHISHVWAALSFCLGISIFFELRRRHQTGGKRKK